MIELRGLSRTREQKTRTVGTDRAVRNLRVSASTTIQDRSKSRPEDVKPDDWTSLPRQLAEVTQSGKLPTAYQESLSWDKPFNRMNHDLIEDQLLLLRSIAADGHQGEAVHGKPEQQIEYSKRKLPDVKSQTISQVDDRTWKRSRLTVIKLFCVAAKRASVND